MGRTNDRENEVVRSMALPPLTFAVFREETAGDAEEPWVAICLELDLAGQGANREAALRDCQSAVEVFLGWHYEHGEQVNYDPAPADLWAKPDLVRLFPTLTCIQRKANVRAAFSYAREQHPGSFPAPNACLAS